MMQTSELPEWVRLFCWLGSFSLFTRLLVCFLVVAALFAAGLSAIVLKAGTKRLIAWLSRKSIACGLSLGGGSTLLILFAASVIAPALVVPTPIPAGKDTIERVSDISPSSDPAPVSTKVAKSMPEVAPPTMIRVTASGVGGTSHDFDISKYEITNAEYQSFKPSMPLPDYGREFRGPQNPVVGVSWYEAVAYCEWLSNQTGRHYRLPTEAEWDVAAGASAGFSYPWGNDEPTKQLANYGKGNNHPVGVGSYPAGGTMSGVMDMAGNVSEWCLSTMGDGTSGKKPVRGGSWRDYARSLHNNERISYPPEVRKEFIGFRVVCECDQMAQKKEN